MKKNLWRISASLLAISFFILIGIASGESEKKEDSATDQTDNTPESTDTATIDGTYKMSDSYGTIEIAISGNSWSCTVIPITGFGEANDRQNATTSSGPIKGNDLYDNTGLVIVGQVSGITLNTDIGGQDVTLFKK